MRIIWAILVLLMTGSATAGPWLRPDGEGFMSVDSIGSIGRNQGDLSYYSGLYAEYGINDRTTLGLTGGVDLLYTGSGTVFVRKPLTLPHKFNQNWTASFDFGAGISHEAGVFTKHVRMGVSLGRGLQFKKREGWLAFDGIALFEKGQAAHLKVEGIVGTTGQKGWHYMLQGFADRPANAGWGFEVAPSIAIPFFKKQKIQIGISASTYDGGRYGGRLSVWQEF